MSQHSLTQKLTMLTIKETASLLVLSIDETTLLAASGQIRCFRLGCNGDVLRFIRSDVDAFFEANQTVKQTTGER